jgi:predicted transcriptional regulator
MTNESTRLVDLAAMVVAAYVAHNNVTRADLPDLIANTHAVLTGLGAPPAAPAAEPLVPAVPIKKSVTPDAIICLEDGMAFKSMKRHLSSKYDMTPEQYRAKWGLPTDYPMVAPNYAEARSVMAKALGLGRKPAAAVVEPAPAKSPRRARAKTTA